MTYDQAGADSLMELACARCTGTADARHFWKKTGRVPSKDTCSHLLDSSNDSLTPQWFFHHPALWLPNSFHKQTNTPTVWNEVHQHVVCRFQAARPAAGRDVRRGGRSPRPPWWPAPLGKGRV